MKKLIKKHKLPNMNNSGSTMVEVLVGFVILVMVIVECMVHLVGVSSDMVVKSKDTLVACENMNSEMYKKNANYILNDGITFTLKLDEDKTDMLANQAQTTNITLEHAKLYKYTSEKAGFSVYKIDYKE